MYKLFTLLILALAIMVATGCGSTTGVSGYETVKTVKTFKLSTNYQSYVVQAVCPADKKVISGGYSAPLAGVGERWGVDSYDGYISANRPVKNAWNVESYVKNKAVGTFTLGAFAICVK